MIRSMTGLKALGLSVLALGLMAFGASSAQAAGHWNVNGSPISESLLPEVQGAIESPHAYLLSGSLGLKIELLCAKGELINAKLGPKGTVDLGVKVKFKECKMYTVNSKGVLSEQAACEPNAGGTQPGVIITEEGLGELVLHTLANGEKVDLTEVRADNPQLLLVEMETNAECAIGEKIPVYGKLFLKDCEGSNLLSEQVTHLVEQGPLTDLWILEEGLHSMTELASPEHLATLDGSANLFLAGAHKEMKWSGNPE